MTQLIAAASIQPAQPAVVPVAATAAPSAVWTPSATGHRLRSGSCPTTTAADLERFEFVRRRGLRRRSEPASMSGTCSVGATAGSPPPTGNGRPRSATVPALGETLAAWMGQRPLPPTPPTRPSLDDFALPDGWGTGETPKGETFYIHHETQRISWEHPTKKQAAAFFGGTDL